MLFQSEVGMINVLLEPQFAALCSEPLYTVQVSDIATFQTLELPAFVEHLLSPAEPLFPFIGYAYAWHLEHLMNQEEISKIEKASQDFSAEPLGFVWQSQITNTEFELEENSDYDWGDELVGFCLPDELKRDQSRQPAAAACFRAYPIHRLPTNDELNTVWISQQNEN
ncbi:MAG: hypothetical protein ACOVMF_00115 [Aquiluna sp.]|jgi:hypothetical protein